MMPPSPNMWRSSGPRWMDGGLPDGTARRGYNSLSLSPFESAISQGNGEQFRIRGWNKQKEQFPSLLEGPEVCFLLPPLQTRAGRISRFGLAKGSEPSNLLDFPVAWPSPRTPLAAAAVSGQYFSFFFPLLFTDYPSCALVPLCSHAPSSQPNQPSTCTL